MIWTNEMSQMLADLYRRSFTMGEIAAKLNEQFDINLTRSAIAGQIHRRNLRNEIVKVPQEKRPRVDAPIPPVLEPAKVVSVAVAAAPAAKPVKVIGVGITIYQLDSTTCRWPGTDVEEYPPYSYCGKQVHENLPYCTEHCAAAYNAPQKTWY